MTTLRQPIAVFMGHVDHGKTSLLDAIRETSVQSREVGAITQSISASEVPASVLRERCAPVLARMKLELKIPGVLFIDTPGHADFTNLRKRGGSIADIAVLVIDVTKGVEAQTVEALEILREFKTPFLVALNKIDALTGWRSADGAPFSEANAQQRPDVQAALDAKLYQLVGKLYEFGVNAERFDRVGDFTRQVTIVPVSAKTNEGLPELLLFIAGLAQRFLEKQLAARHEAAGKANVLEVREEKGLGKTLDAILYEGTLRPGDAIVFASAEGPVVSRAKALAKPPSLQDAGRKLVSVDEARAASGVVVACDGAERALAGSTLYVANSPAERDAARADIAAEVGEIVRETGQAGVLVRADALGSLEAITKLFEREGVPVRRAALGTVTKRDVLEAASVRERHPYVGVVFAFNVPVDPDAAAEAKRAGVRVFEEKIIYNLVQGYAHWRDDARASERREAFAKLSLPARLHVMAGHVFRQSNPAVFGVELDVGTLKKGATLLNEAGTPVGVARDIQKDKASVDEAKRGDQVAISVPNVTLGRQIKERDVLYAAVPEADARLLTTKYADALSPDEKTALQTIKKLQGFVF